MDVVEIKIAKWEKYQKRKDVENPWWFAVSNELWRSPGFSFFSSDEKVVWYAILAAASKDKSGTVKFCVSWFAACCGVSEGSVISAIEKIEQNQWATAIRTDSVRNFPATEHNSTVQNRTKQNRTIQKIKEEEDIRVCTEQSPSADCIGAHYPQEISDSVCIEFFLKAGIKPSIVTLWLKTYEEPGWLKQEVLKILAWLDANPQKKPKKNFAKFVGSWLSRGWEWHRKNLPSNKANRVLTQEELESDVRNI